jgi:signal transduction histidine kinase
LGNAIKYSPGGGEITVCGRKDKRQLLIQVSDQGIGIPSGELEKVFERFYRIENDSTQSVRGVGLGLAVCRGIVEAHGGRIWVESTPGMGSTFYFTLPIGAEE